MSDDTFTKREGTTRRITGDWSDFLGTGVSISSVAYTASSPSGLTYGTPSNTSTTETQYYSGGTFGNLYEVVITVTTDESPARVEAKAIFISVERDC